MAFEPVQFLVPFPDDSEATRVDLSLGLRRAVRYYNDLVVPGIGGAYRVRHVSWAVAGLLLKEELTTTATAAVLAQAFEALGNKLAWTQAPEDERRELRVRGKRAFGREPGEWTFARLSTRSHYVQATIRQQVTRALPVGDGIGLAEGSSRFNAMTLTPAGRELAAAFLDQKVEGQGKPALRTRLRQWLAKDFTPHGAEVSLANALGPDSASATERAVVDGRLDTPVTGGATADADRRRRLIRYFREQGVGSSWRDSDDLLEWLNAHDGANHANDITAAIAFEAMRDAGVAVLAAVAAGLDGNRVSALACARGTVVKGRLATLRKAAADYKREANRAALPRRDALEFATLPDGADAQTLLCELVRRDGRVLRAAGDTIWRGALFRPNIGRDRDAEADDENPNLGRPNRLFQFLELWRDCRG